MIPAEVGVDGSEAIKNLGPGGLVAKAYSAPEVFERKMDYLTNRPPSGRVLIFDFSPRAPLTLAAWQLPATDFPTWTRATQRITRAVQRATERGRSPTAPPSDIRYSTRLQDFFDALRSAEDGTVILVYGHATPDRIMVESSDQGVTSIDKDRLQTFFRENSAERRASVVLLNCGTEAQLAKTRPLPRMTPGMDE